MVAGRIATELAMEYRYKLRMMGFQVKEPTKIFIDNKSVINSSTQPSSVLKKKHQFVAWHKIREAHAAGIIQATHVSGIDNYSDVLTKSLGPSQHYNITKGVLFGRDEVCNQGELEKITSIGNDDIPSFIIISDGDEENDGNG